MEDINVKKRYSDEELAMFKKLILDKLTKAEADYAELRETVVNGVWNTVSDTSPTFKVMDEGAATLIKEQSELLSSKQLQYIQKLRAALCRIENKTYGICRKTGRLIPKDRLMAVPHATLSIEAKIEGKK